MTDEVSGHVPGSTADSDNRTVTMSQRAFDALIGETKRETREKESAKNADLIREEAAKMAAEIAEKKAEEFLTRREQENERKRAEDEESKLRAKTMESAERLKKQFQASGEKHKDFNELAAQYEWQDPRNQRVLLQLDDDEVDNAGDVLHHLMKEDVIDKLSLRSPDAIRKKVKEISLILKENENTKPERRDVPEPTSRPKPSHIPNKGDGGPMVVGQFQGRRYKN